MTDFYGVDRWTWPITINSSNKNLRVVEDPSGTPTNIDITLTESSGLGSDGVYYACGESDPETGFSGSVTTVDGSDDNLDVRPLYAEIARLLDSESSSTGSSLDYRFTAITPTNSSLTNSGVRLTTANQNTEIQLDFTISDSLDPRFFGLAENTTTSTIGTSIDGDRSRWGTWQSPLGAQPGHSDGAHDKRRELSTPTFGTSPHRYERKLWRWQKQERNRMIKYVGVAGVHVWAEDRASRSAETDRGGVAADETNNALEHLREYGTFGDDQILVVHNNGDGSLEAELSGTGNNLEVVKLGREFATDFAPQKTTDREHEGEKYDLEIPVSAADLDDYDTSNVSPYGH